MDISKARKILWEVWKELSDEKIKELITLYRAIARVFIDKHQQSKLETLLD